jgi:hypothetical protein
MLISFLKVNKEKRNKKHKALKSKLDFMVSKAITDVMIKKNLLGIKPGTLKPLTHTLPELLQRCREYFLCKIYNATVSKAKNKIVYCEETAEC